MTTLRQAMRQVLRTAALPGLAAFAMAAATAGAAPSTASEYLPAGLAAQHAAGGAPAGYDSVEDGGGARLAVTNAATAIDEIRPETLSEAQRQRIGSLAAGWTGEPDYSTGFDAIDPNVRISDFAAAAARFDPRDEYHGLPREEGFELVDAYCTACHSLRIVMQQHATRERWDDLLVWMVEKQGMPALPGDEREVVMDYLATHFGAGQQ